MAPPLASEGCNLLASKRAPRTIRVDTDGGRVVALSPEGEARRQITDARRRVEQQYGATSFERISDALDRQFRTIHNRAQLLLGICGVLISASVVVTTGRVIGRRPEYDHQRVAGHLLVAAGLF